MIIIGRCKKSAVNLFSSSITIAHCDFHVRFVRNDYYIQGSVVQNRHHHMDGMGIPLLTMFLDLSSLCGDASLWQHHRPHVV